MKITFHPKILAMSEEDKQAWQERTGKKIVEKKPKRGKGGGR